MKNTKVSLFCIVFFMFFSIICSYGQNFEMAKNIDVFNPVNWVKYQNNPVMSPSTSWEVATDEDVISFTYVPACGSFEYLQGKTSGIIPEDYKVAVYIRVEKGWWTKPYFAWPLTTINPDGTWKCNITTGGNDQDATEIAAYLVPNGYNPPLMSGQCSLPDELNTQSVGYAKVNRNCGYRQIQFSGYSWRLKSSTSKMGPGPNYFSDSEENVWVDNQGRLHLRITERNGNWYCPEVILQESFGYGDYKFYIANKVDHLDKNVVLGLFTWDECYDSVYSYREMDIEFAKWSNDENDNAQFVVQPYNLPGNMYRFNMEQSVNESVHSFMWQENRVRFQSVYNCYEFWAYNGGSIPRPGGENVRINLWLFNGIPPSDGHEVEVIIEKFEYNVNGPTDSVILISPNGGENWKGGSNQVITWSASDNNVDHIKLLYSTDGGNTYPNTIIANTPNIGNYSWTLPFINSDNVRVKVIAENSNNVELASDVSDNDFTIETGLTGWFITLTTSSTAQDPALLANALAPVQCIMGAHPNAKDDFDPMDVPAPPRGISPVLDAYFEGTPLFPRLFTDYREEIAHSSFNKTWIFHAFTDNNTGDGFRICWDASGLPQDLNAIIKQVDPKGPQINMRNQSCFDTIFLNNKEYKFTITVSQKVCMNLDLKAGWNMVSCPGDPVEKDIASLIAGTLVLPFVYTWDPNIGGYVMVNKIEFGFGYWMASTEDTQFNICYTPKTELSQSVKPGWNMMGSISCSYPVSKLPAMSDPVNSLLTYVYTWNASTGGPYVLVNNMDPGVGYWVASMQNATTNMNCAGVATSPDKSLQVLKPTWRGMLKVQTQDMNQQLFFGMHPGASLDFDKFLDRPMPPMPGMINNMLKAFWTIPSQSFTALDSSYIKEDSHGEWELSLELPEPGEVIWSNLPSAYRCLLWYDNTVVTMNTRGFLPLPAGKHNLKLVLDAYTSLPGETQLLSNYPNPCNPETWIPYRLSEDSEVSIIIHDVSGREVRRINLGQQFAGEYVNKDRALYWDGRNERGEIVSSGLYFYTLKAGGISQTGKMVIVR